MSKLGFETTNGVAVSRFENPPVNSFGLEMRGLLWSALARAEADAAIGAVILIGSGKGFSGGADIREFGTPESYAEPNLRTLLRAIEECAKPVIAAIEGICMGGGLEMALACHYRVAGTSARVALPGVKLGLLPGAGGTQRLPRVIASQFSDGSSACVVMDAKLAERRGLDPLGIFAVLRSPAVSRMRWA
jgi:3-hydroxyacyl-CoA dehydrogenase